LYESATLTQKWEKGDLCIFHRIIPLSKEYFTSEKFARVTKKHQVPVSVRPAIKALRRLLVHPKDKQEKEEVTDCVYKIPCSNCETTYIGETGRKFGSRLKEHKTEVEATTSKPFTRSQHISSLSEQNKSALTDHARHDNHIINWSESTILDRESNKRYQMN